MNFQGNQRQPEKPEVLRKVFESLLQDSFKTRDQSSGPTATSGKSASATSSNSCPVHGQHEAPNSNPSGAKKTPNVQFCVPSTTDGCDCSFCSSFKDFKDFKMKDLNFLDLFGKSNKQECAEGTILEGCDPGQVDFYDFPTCYEFYMELPGVKKANIDLKIAEGYLVVQATRAAHPSVREGDLKCEDYCEIGERNISSRKFGRKLKLNSPVLIEQCRVTFEDGVLSFMIPKAKPEPPKEVKIPLI